MRVIWGMRYDDREVFLQTISEARHALTDRQFQCLLMQLAGYEQAEIAEFMSISQQGVSFHFQAALEKVSEVAKRYLYEGVDISRK